jgi:hypothetical protein
MLTKETIEEMRSGFHELSRQFGSDFLKINWKEYGENLKDKYYGTGKETPKLF